MSRLSQRCGCCFMTHARVTAFPRVHRAIVFSLPVAAASLVIAGLNQHLYGSATASGYGSIENLFAPRYLRQNIVNYTVWLVQSHTPLAVVGLVALWIPGRAMKSGRLQMRGRGLVGGMSLAVAGSYVLYESFGEWWYLRFLLPCWPALTLGSSGILASPGGRSFSRIAKIVLLLVGAYGVYYAHGNWAFHLGRGDQRYIRVAQLVAAATEANSVVITLQHSGSLRYYGGRTTVRYDYVHAGWLDRVILSLRDRGVNPYILLDDREHEEFKSRFASQNNFGRLDLAKVFEYRDTTSTVLYRSAQVSLRHAHRAGPSQKRPLDELHRSHAILDAGWTPSCTMRASNRSNDRPSRRSLRPTIPRDPRTPRDLTEPRPAAHPA